MKRCLPAVLISVLLLAGCATEPISVATAPITLATAHVDLNHDGRLATVSLDLISGRRYDDTELWCGMGQKVEGEFALTVSVGGKKTVTELNKFYSGNDSLWFWDDLFDLIFQDYTGDGRVEFNLGQYESCGGWKYRLFVIAQNGVVSPLPGAEIYSSDHANSTHELEIGHGTVIAHYYYVDRSGPRTAIYQWNQAQNTFQVKQDSSDDGSTN